MSMSMSMPSSGTPGVVDRSGDDWVRVWQPRPDARLRLICFHPAGAGPTFFRPWAIRMPEQIEVLAVQLPGRESRFAEPLITDYRQAVAALYAGLRRRLTEPYALFGHSMGATLAYGVALEAVRHGDPAPTRLFLSGAAAPGAEPLRKDHASWTDQEFVADLRTMGGTPEAVLAERDLLAVLLPILRADYAVCDAFRAGPPAGNLLECPISILGGAADTCTPDQLARWTDTTRGASNHRTFPGGHFFLTGESADAVLHSVANDLTDAIG